MKFKFQFLLFRISKEREKTENSHVISARGIFAETTVPGSLPIKRGRLVSEEATRRLYFKQSNNQKLRQRRLHFIISRNTLFRVAESHLHTR